MDPAVLQAYAAVGALIVTAAGVVLVILQLRGLEQSVTSAAHAAVNAQGSAFRAHLVAYPHLRKYFFDGEQIDPSHEDYVRAVTIAELFLNHLEQIAIMVRTDSLGRRNSKPAEGFIRSALAKSLVARLREYPQGFSPELQKYLD